MDKPLGYEPGIPGSNPGGSTNKLCTYVVVVASDFTKVEARVRIPIGALQINYALVAKPGNAADCNSAIREFKSLQVLYISLV